MTGSRLIELQQQGQSVWYDHIRRGLIASGELARLVADGVTGVTSNPSIFEKAITGSRDYDDRLRTLVADRKDVTEIYETLAIEDIQVAADLLRPIYERTEGREGFVSMEVSPKLAHDASGTIKEAHGLAQAVGRPNLMIKVPATRAGVQAIEQLIGDGVNVNVTLLFSVERYASVANAYLVGLERRVREGKPIDRVASVASFFVSRVDSLVDTLLQAKIRKAANEAEARRLEALLGTAAIANAQLAYAKFKEIFSEYAGAVELTLADLEKRQAAARVWARDPSLWKSEADHPAIIRRSLGWLTVAEMMGEHVGELEGFADEVKRSGFADVVLLGMGGSSLCPDVLRVTFGHQDGSQRDRVRDDTSLCGGARDPEDVLVRPRPGRHRPALEPRQRGPLLAPRAGPGRAGEGPGAGANPGLCGGFRGGAVDPGPRH